MNKFVIFNNNNRFASKTFKHWKSIHLKLLFFKFRFGLGCISQAGIPRPGNSSWDWTACLHRAYMIAQSEVLESTFGKETIINIIISEIFWASITSFFRLIKTSLFQNIFLVFSIDMDHLVLSNRYVTFVNSETYVI